ncbi:hypothetical protein D1007_61120 [Hordeum vulgare]|nr:hypothetical protein D1007_61120 [Hordeum vulgare]
MISTACSPVAVGGDDGVNAYGAGQHRGSSLHGGGRGYAWESNVGHGQGFSGPTWNFVPGPAGSKRGGYRQRWGGRGGGRRAPPQVDYAVADKVEHAQPQPEAPPISLPPSLGTVEAGVAVDRGVIAPRMEGGDRPTKWARKKEKMTCYLCGENGHFVSECSAVLCELCLKPVHGSSWCPLMTGPMPVMAIYSCTSAPSSQHFGSFQPEAMPVRLVDYAQLPAHDVRHTHVKRSFGKQAASASLQPSSPAVGLQPISLDCYLHNVKQEDARTALVVQSMGIVQGDSGAPNPSLLAEMLAVDSPVASMMGMTDNGGAGYSKSNSNTQHKLQAHGNAATATDGVQQQHKQATAQEQPATGKASASNTGQQQSNNYNGASGKLATASIAAT